MKALISFLILFSCLATESPDPFLGEDMETGYVDVGRGELFYWFFGPRNNDTSAPVMLWLTGGPGCSSSTALFFENGPFQVNNNSATLKKNPYSWNDKAYLLFVDQPVGTGFSTNRNFVVNEEQISHDMKIFLEKFMEMPKHKPLVKNEFYISGESYAGHYVPAIGAYLAKHSKIINLKGIAIGNGLVSPYHQYGEYANYAYEHGKLNAVTKAFSNIGFFICQVLISLNLWPLATAECQLNLVFIMGLPFYPFFNPYDITKKCEHPPLCYDMARIGTFLNKPEIQERIKTKVKTYKDCSMLVHIFLLADWWFDFTDSVRYLLDEKNITVMVYSGDLDFICNWRGNEAWAHKFKWNGTQEFNKLEYKKWSTIHIKWKKNPAEYKVLNKFSFIRVFKAGHMVPMDKPEYSLEMINEFMFGGIK